MSLGNCIATLKRTNHSTTVSNTNGFKKPLKSYSSQVKSSNSHEMIKSFSSIIRPTNDMPSRLLLLIELMQTEMKYLNDLKFIENIYGTKISGSIKPDNPEMNINPNEYKTVFQPVRDLIQYHSANFDTLSEMVENYDNITTCIGNLFNF